MNVTSDPLLQLILTRLREHFREPEALFWVYGFPIIMAVGLGIAFWDREPEAATVDLCQGPDPRVDESLRQRLEEAKLVVEIHDEEACRRRLRTGKTALYARIESSTIHYIFDRTRPESQTARLEVDAIVTAWRAEMISKEEREDGRRVVERTVGTASWRTLEEPVREPGSRYIDFLIPGLMGLNIMGGGLFGVGFVLVDMRVRKLLKRLVATPMRRSHFLMAIMATRLILLLPEMGILLCVAAFGFGVPIRGALVSLGIAITMGAFAFAGIGLLLASRADKMESISGLVNLVMLPGWLLSGTFFSAKRFPEAAQPIIQALPLTQLNDALREVMLEGAGLSDIAWRLAILATYGGVTFLLALKWFRWR